MNQSHNDLHGSRNTVEYEGREAVRRLAELGLTDELIVRAMLRADAEALMCTDLDPTNMEGMIRWGRLVRYFREETVPLGWTTDNTNNFHRTVHPQESLSIVVSSGDENVGVPGTTPTTKYAKGITTVEAVAANADPGLFEVADLVQAQPDDGDDVLVADVVDGGIRPVGYLLFRVTPDQIFLELSFPDRTDLEDQDPDEDAEGAVVRQRKVHINGWAERILLPGIDRGDVVQELPDDVTAVDDYDVAVSPR